MSKVLNYIEDKLIWLVTEVMVYASKYKAILSFVIIIGLTSLLFITDCGGLFSLDNNAVSKSDAKVIVNNMSCAWNDDFDVCFCIYANAGAIGMGAPDRMCGRP